MHTQPLMSNDYKNEMKETRTYSNKDKVKAVEPAKKKEIGAIVYLNRRDAFKSCVQLRYLQDLRVSVSVLVFVVEKRFLFLGFRYPKFFVCFH